MRGLGTNVSRAKMDGLEFFRLLLMVYRFYIGLYETQPIKPLLAVKLTQKDDPLLHNIHYLDELGRRDI